MITKGRLKEFLSYDCDTGLFTWVDRAVKSFRTKGHYHAFKRDRMGRIAGAKSKAGYLTATLDGRSYLLHRLAWLCVHGEYPKKGLDHINGKKSDNRISNLREATQEDQNKNHKRHKNNTSGRTGVNWLSSANHWQVRIGNKNKRIFIGAFKNLNDAISAREDAEIKYNYHENHDRIEE